MLMQSSAGEVLSMSDQACVDSLPVTAEPRCCLRRTTADRQSPKNL